MALQEHTETYPTIELSEWKVKGLWSNAENSIPPAFNQTVKVTFNGWGKGRVVGYFEENGYLGLRVIPEQVPEWFQGTLGEPIHVFGAECRY
tara:strand:+ start:82 stop:357 length:276 start_codon:yes stop_codon:yes gene_type:complete